MSDDPATVAFDQLRAEVALLRRAIEGLSARQAEPAPDYAPTLAKLNRAVVELREFVGQMSEGPALSLTPEMIAAQILKHAAVARSEAHRELAEAASQVSQASSALATCGGQIRVRDAQRRWLGYAAMAGAAASLVAWMGLAGPISRALPASWQVPERVAAAALGQDRWAAGARMMRGADPSAWRLLSLGEGVVVQNRRVLDACWKRAERLGRPISCEVRIGG